ncbi:MAG: hypothetical protein APF76_07450 [Desulfitibacter sp. BRH_c19]|nr:MAG: hypothetical protein APF76_07450 [Desulfitibacter sp. BRH_c19]
MKIVYHCYGGSHSSVTTAAIHLGYLPNHRRPTSEELMGLPFFDKQIDKDHGKFNLMGKDEIGNEVYICGCRSLGSKVEKTLQGVAKITNTPIDDMIFIDTLNGVNNLMRVGGFLSRKLKLVSMGRPLVLEGTINSFNKFVDMVGEVKKNIAQR